MFSGVDEAGRGSVMGPLVVAAVYAESDGLLREIGVKDSKRLTPKVRESMFDRISESFITKVVMLSASEIDSRRERLTLNEIELEMFLDVSASNGVARIFADCPDVNESHFKGAMEAKLEGIEVISKHRADDTYPIVSAASIIAKVTRDRVMEDIAAEFDKDVGSGYPSDEVTMGFIEKWLNDNGAPPPHTRNSWKPVRTMMSLSKNTKITDW